MSVFSDLLSLVVVGFFGLLPFPQFLGEVLSVFLFLGLGLVYSLVVWLCLLEINAYLSKKKKKTAFVYIYIY